MNPSADFITAIFSVGRLPISLRKRCSLLAAYLKATVLRRLGLKGRGAVSIWGLKHFSANWRMTEFLIKEIYIGMAYFFPLQKAEKIFDVGANCGFAALFFKSMFPHAEIVSIEPQARESGLLREAVSLNHLDGIRVLQYAVGQTEDQAILSVNEKNPGFSSLLKSRAGGKNEEFVSVVRLSSLLPEQPVDLLKMDIEGAEGAVLNELSEAGCLSVNRIRNMIIEVHRFEGSGLENFTEILNLIARHGYEYCLQARAFRLLNRTSWFTADPNVYNFFKVFLPQDTF